MTTEDYCEIGQAKHETGMCHGQLRDMTLVSGPQTMTKGGRSIEFNSVEYTITVCEVHYRARSAWQPIGTEVKE